MKSTTLTLALAVGALGSIALPAHGQAMPEAQTLRAQVIDTACYINFDLKGADHKMCAEVCANAGVPLGFLGQDGQVYMAAGPGMPSIGQNEALIGHAEQQVEVTGSVFTRGGSRTIVINKIEPVGS